MLALFGIKSRRLMMCGGVEYTDVEEKTWKIYFPSPKAALPVVKWDGAVEWVTWGKRKEEQHSYFAPGGWPDLTQSTMENGSGFTQH